MYENYWNLAEKPFKNTPDPQYLYNSKEHEEAIFKLVYAIEEDLGCAVLSGIFGCGKTVISQALCSKLAGDRYQVVYINNPQLDYVDLLRSIVRKLKPIELSSNKNELSVDFLLEKLEEILINNARDGKKTVIIIDEAHIIRDEQLFESLRLLLNFQTDSRYLLTLLLMGQPELQDNIKSNKQFEQRVAIKSHLEAFTCNDTSAYIKHRLNVAGAKYEIFTAEAINKIWQLSGGIPRRINRVCDVSLLNGFGKQLKEITPLDVEEAVKMTEY